MLFFSFYSLRAVFLCAFFFQAEDGIRDGHVMEFRRVLFRSQGGAAGLMHCASIGCNSTPHGSGPWIGATSRMTMLLSKGTSCPIGVGPVAQGSSDAAAALLTSPSPLTLITRNSCP